MARKTTTVPNTNLSDTQIEEHLEQYSLAESRRDGLKAKMEEQLTKVREKFVDKINAEEEIMDEHFDTLHAHAMTQKDQFDKKRSKAFTHGILGFRIGTPKLKNQRGFTWKAVLELVKDHNLTDFIKVKESLDKDKIIANREELAADGTLDTIKCEVVQDETFYVDTKAEKKDAK